MTSNEKRAVFSLAILMALRMVGLFMVLPVFALYAAHFIDTTPFLIGLAIGVYGLTQALFQIPLGALSDHFGRKKIISLGLMVFIIGSFMAGSAHSIQWLILGRALQGAGAIGSTIMATLADLTTPTERTKAMAIVGMTIGFSFSVAMVLGPLVVPWINVNGIFYVASAMGIIALFWLFWVVPTPKKTTWHQEAELDIRLLPALFKHPELLRLNVGIFLLHAIFTASFVAIPISLQTLVNIPGNQQWLIFLPTAALAFLISIPAIIIAEKKHQVRAFFIGAILLLGLSELLLWIFAKSLVLSSVNILLFFTAFSLLEAFLPSLVSKIAPKERKGTALGIYSSSQFSGIFVGGALGGWLYGTLGLTEVHLFCAILSIIWMTIAFSMKNPQYSQKL